MNPERFVSGAEINSPRQQHKRKLPKGQSANTLSEVSDCAYARSDPKWRSYIRMRAGAKRRGIPFGLSFAEFSAICERTDYINQTGLSYRSLVFDRIDNSKGYVVGSIQVITRSANSKKASGEDRAHPRALVSKGKKSASGPRARTVPRDEVIADLHQKGVALKYIASCVGISEYAAAASVRRMKGGA